MLTRLWALIRMRCPHCLRGNVFRRPFAAHEYCAVCQIRFEREEGYWSTAIFFGYVLYFAIMLPLLLVLYFSGFSLRDFLLITAAFLLALIPVVFHYGRITWLHVDEVLDPR